MLNQQAWLKKYIYIYDIETNKNVTKAVKKGKENVNITLEVNN